MSIRKASKNFGISFRMLRNKTKGLHTRKVGQPFQLTPECEAKILDAIQCLTVWKVPLTGQDISFLLKVIWIRVELWTVCSTTIFLAMIG